MHIFYDKIPDLEYIYLEDSYVLALDESESRLIWALEAVLTEQHPEYQAPLLGIQYCYRKAILELPAVEHVLWHEKDFRAYGDATDEVDYGNIDAFYAQDGAYHLEGGWGQVTIHSATPQLRLVDP